MPKMVGSLNGPLWTVLMEQNVDNRMSYIYMYRLQINVLDRIDTLQRSLSRLHGEMGTWVPDAGIMGM